MKKKRSKATKSSPFMDAAILAGRAEGRTFDELGKMLGMTRQGVHSRVKTLEARRPNDALVGVLQRTNRLLAGVIVRICQLQTTGDEYPRMVLSGLGLTTVEIADALGTTAVAVNVAKHRARRKQQGAVETETVQ